MGVIAWSDDGKYLAAGYREGVRVKKHDWKKKMQAYNTLKGQYDKKKASKKANNKKPIVEENSDNEARPKLQTIGSVAKFGALMNGSEKFSGRDKPISKNIASKNIASKIVNAKVEIEVEMMASKPVPDEDNDDEEDEEVGPEPVKPPEPDLVDDPETYYVLIYDATKVVVDPSKPGHDSSSMTLIQSIPFEETITSLDWGKMSTLLSVTSADVDPTDAVQQGSCRVFKKAIGEKNSAGLNTVSWRRESPEEFPFVATPLSKVQASAAAWLEELCTEYKIPAMKTSAFAFGTRRRSGAAEEKTRLMVLCEKLKEGSNAEAQQLKLYDR